MKIHHIAALCGLACAFWPALLSAQSNPEVAQLFQHAADQSDFTASGSPPFDLDATFQVTDSVGKKFDGSYRLIWTSIDQWREEINLGDYSRVRVGVPGKYWQKRSIDFELAQVYQLSQALNFPKTLHEDASSATDKIKLEKKGSLPSKCTWILPPSKIEEEFCFDPSNGTLDFDYLLHNGSDGQSEITSREYSDFMKVAEKMYPKTITIMSGGAKRIVFSVNHLVVPAQVDPALFAVPHQAQAWDFCADLVPANKIHVSIPVYPEFAKQSHLTGIVRVYGVIGTDGSFHNLKVVASPGPSLSAAALQAAEKSKYEPASCKSAPIPFETFIDFTFTIGR
jgi:Gram-negative bacterial TonB protein C-terminal